MNLTMNNVLSTNFIRAYPPVYKVRRYDVIRGRGFHSDQGAGSIIHLNEFDFTRDIYNKQLLTEYHDVIGPGRFRLPMRWALSTSEEYAKLGDMDEADMEKCSLHGLWPYLRRLLTPTELQLDHLLLSGKEDDFHELIEEHKQLILSHWPGSSNPKSIEAAKKFISREWNGHGKPVGIPLQMYVFHSLSLKMAFPSNCGIPVGVPMTLAEAAECVKVVLADLHLFGEHIGAEVLPEIRAVINPYDVSGPFLIKEIRPHFDRVLIDGAGAGAGVFRVVDVEEYDENGSKKNKYYTGSANDGKNIVILPSHQDVLRWIK